MTLTSSLFPFINQDFLQSEGAFSSCSGEYLVTLFHFLNSTVSTSRRHVYRYLRDLRENGINLLTSHFPGRTKTSLKSSLLLCLGDEGSRDKHNGSTDFEFSSVPSYVRLGQDHVCFLNCPCYLPRRSGEEWKIHYLSDLEYFHEGKKIRGLMVSVNFSRCLLNGHSTK